MKTLTLFSGFLEEFRDFVFAVKANATEDILDAQQKRVEEKGIAVAKRLQEQEEELEELRKWKSDTILYAGSPTY